ncbi:penicillin-binding protein 2 [Dyella japonica]|uniref:Peptidoglycan D,D-transpeptidase MrdA n=1 Tax=Dyella japonica A8 TaxID=1217721 RepID=A0A075K7D0_9GAMM|nr:penicillin-binding protein 2 [Dyella japonica]AIF49557.1 penicillin-binding protein [Dyella japonica A8]
MALRRRAIKDARGEATLFRVRAFVGFALILIGLGVLVARYQYLQVRRHDEFALRSENNRMKPRAIPPARGLIYDRNGVLLADNVPAFRLEVVPEQVKDMQGMLSSLREVVPLDDGDLEAFRKQLKQNRRFDSVPLKLHLTEDEIDRFAINRWRFPGVDVVPYLTRRYPYGPLFAHVVGYVGRIDADDMNRLDQDRYKGTSHVGRSGLERSYEDMLHGEPGYELVEVNADGRVQRVLETHAPTPGKNLYLSIDMRVQKAATDAFQGRPGSAVAIDPRNGQVLAMASVPSFDPNLFVNGISKADYTGYMTAEDKPLLNRALKSAYPPGSTVKPFLALGGLELGIRRPEDTVLSTGEFCIPGQQRCYRDDVRGGNGTVNMVRAIQLSTNTYFYKLALDMGIDRLANWMGSLGFGKKTGIDLLGEAEGILPSPEWKATRSKYPWFKGETVIAGIGQGYWNVTALQLAHATATFAGHGTPYAPRLVMATSAVKERPVPLPNTPAGPSLIRKPHDWDVVNQGMLAVVNEVGGTAKGQFTGFPYLVAGKSGTAERFSRRSNEYDTNKNTAYLAARHRAWFIGYTPAEAPRIAVVAMLESGAWGASDAGPIVRKVMEAWLASTGGPVPPKNPEGEPAAPSSAPDVPEDTPVVSPADMSTMPTVPADSASAAPPEDGGNP